MLSKTNVFSQTDLDQILGLENVAEAYAQVSSFSDGVSFTIPLTDGIRTALQTQLDLKIAVDVSSVPLRWIRGDTAPHVDTGALPFEYTYLVRHQ
jgi:hypothetical protein